MKEKILMSWSGGKDSAVALWELQRAGEYEIDALLTSVTEGYDRISMHGVRNELLERQAAALGVPLERVQLPKLASNEVYEERMGAAMEAAKARGITRVAFGDLYLEGIRSYREENLARVGMDAIFPVWLRETRQFAKDFLSAGFRTMVVCVDTAQLGAEFVGREIDEAFLAEFPEGVDPCGEKGEFHTFVFDGPNFSEPVQFELGEKRIDGQFHFRDLVPA